MKQEKAHKLVELFEILATFCAREVGESKDQHSDMGYFLEIESTKEEIFDLLTEEEKE